MMSQPIVALPTVCGSATVSLLVGSYTDVNESLRKETHMRTYTRADTMCTAQIHALEYTMHTHGQTCKVSGIELHLDPGIQVRGLPCSSTKGPSLNPTPLAHTQVLAPMQEAIGVANQDENGLFQLQLIRAASIHMYLTQSPLVPLPVS